MRRLPVITTCLILTFVAYIAHRCAQTWHSRHGWSADEYFEDSSVIALCRAIEAKDIDAMERLLNSGADINARGTGNMTPLLWAFPDDRREPFRWLLEHGAESNVVITGDLDVGDKVDTRGSSVTHLASRSSFAEHFDNVFEYGGNPNLVSTTVIRSNTTPIFEVIRGQARNKDHRVAKLIELGADLNHMDGLEQTPAAAAVTTGQYELALQILEAGADFQIYRPKSNHNSYTLF